MLFPEKSRTLYRVTIAIEVKNLQGAGRTFVVLFEQDSDYTEDSDNLFQELSKSAKVVLLSIPVINKDNWEQITQKLQLLLEEQKVRQASFISFGDAGVVTQNLYLRNAKIVRSLLLIDGSSSPHPTWWDTFIDSLEKYFPLGLPLRGESKNFNARSHLQRIRCPVLRVSTVKATSFFKAESLAASEAMPTAWSCDLTVDYKDQNQSSVLALIASQFQEIPAKCPQGG